MPEHKSIRIRLVSQYDALFIPEFHSPIDDSHQSAIRNIDAYIPNYSASHFWIRYACDPTTQDPELRFFYFKLNIAGKFAVAWGCGAQDEWNGEAFFVPSNSVSADGSREKLGLFFPSDVGGIPEVPTFEIRVYRARARKRREREYAPEAVVKSGDGGVQLNPIGIVKNREPRRFYTYALMDPKDMPFACFRYHVRTHGELQSRGLVKRSVGDTVPPVQSGGETSYGQIGRALVSSSEGSVNAFEEDEEEEDLMLPTVRTLAQAYAR